MKTKIVCYILTTLITLSSYAQVNVTNTGTLRISSGTDILYINGDFTNSSAASLTNNGKLYVKQNLSNDQASMASGTGTLYLNGGSVQTMSGSQAFKTYNFVSNNNSGITLNNDLSVAGSHTFTSGLITTSATPNYLIYEAGASYTGDDDSKHINGWVKKLGNTDFTFPVGDATYERTAAVSNLSASSEINCHYYTPTQNVYNLSYPVIQVKPNEYWQIDRVAGGTAKITLNWDNSKVPMSNYALADILVAHYTGGIWTDAGGATTATGNTATTGSVTSNAVNSFSPFTIGSAGFTLPLKLISFSGERKTGTTFLHWITENEKNIDYFDIQRSFDGLAFVNIGKLAGKNSGSRELYNFEDYSIFVGIAYYRLRSVDLDGKYSYSKIIAVSEKGINASGLIALNPVRNAITIFNKTTESGPFGYTLFNAAGQLISKGIVTMETNGGAVLSLPSQTAAGIYILEMQNEKIRYTRKLLVEK